MVQGAAIGDPHGLMGAAMRPSLDVRDAHVATSGVYQAVSAELAEALRFNAGLARQQYLEGHHVRNRKEQHVIQVVDAANSAEAVCHARPAEVFRGQRPMSGDEPSVSYTHLRAH